MWKILGQWDILLLISVSQIFFRCLIFDCYNVSICKKGKVTDETSKQICETNEGQNTGMDK